MGTLDIIEHVLRAAKQGQKEAHAHISGYKVGAAIIGDQWGCAYGYNIEFDNFSNTIHAEENAIANFLRCYPTEKMVGVGVVVNDDKAWFPCGMCRQSLFELGGPTLIVVKATIQKPGEYEVALMDTLLPDGFRLDRSKKE